LATESELPPEPQPIEKKVLAVELLALVIEHVSCWAIFQDRAAHLLDELETHLPEQIVVTAKLRGRSRTLEETVALILQAEAATTTLHSPPM
jgi:hypothetical protein